VTRKLPTIKDTTPLKKFPHMHRQTAFSDLSPVTFGPEINIGKYA
jgi:hypothetical protein